MFPFSSVSKTIAGLLYWNSVFKDKVLYIRKWRASHVSKWVKNPPAKQVGDAGSILGSGRLPVGRQ